MAAQTLTVRSRLPLSPAPPLSFHNTGLYNLRGALSYPAANTGLYSHTKNASDVGKFRRPTLRNIALTAPYMHDGSVRTLEEVIDHYAAGGRAIASGVHRGVGSANPNKSPAIDDGIEFVAALLRRQPGMLCVMLTGHRSNHYAEAARSAGAKAYIAKTETHRQSPLFLVGLDKNLSWVSPNSRFRTPLRPLRRPTFSLLCEIPQEIGIVGCKRIFLYL